MRMPTTLHTLLVMLPYLALTSLAVHAFDLHTFVGPKPDPAQITPVAPPPVRVASPKLLARPIAGGLNHPWSLAFLPSGGMLVTERAGQLAYFARNSTPPVRVSGLPKDIQTGGQAGLFDIVLAPDFTQNQTVFLSYAAKVSGGTALKVARAKLNINSQPSLTDLRTIFISEPAVNDNKNLGGRLLFMPDGTLLVSVGDFFEQEQSQNMRTHLGKIIRIHTDGSVPTDNPFIAMEGALPEIYTTGNRNVQGMAARPGSAEIWTHEHGPKGGDEVNILRRGANYGWPLATYGIAYSGMTITTRTTISGTTEPLLHWTPSPAPSGLAFYTGDQVPQWKGNAFVGMLAGTHLRRLDIENGKVIGQEVLLRDLGQRIRDVRMGPDGFLYLLTDARNGQLLRVEALVK